MNVLTKARLKLAKIMNIELGSISTNKDSLYFDGDTYEVGTEVFTMDESGEYIGAPDGEYEAGGQVITVENSVITDIKEATAESTGEGDSGNMEAVESTDEPETISPDEFNTLAEIANNLVDVLNSVQSEIEELKKSKETLKTQLSEVQVSLAKVQGESNGNPIPPATKGADNNQDNDPTARFFNAGMKK